MLKWNTSKYCGFILIYLIFSFIFILPILHFHSLIWGDDIYYHLRRILELSKDLKYGNWYPYIYTYDFRQIGFPLGIFYPQLTLLPFVILKLLIGGYVKPVMIGIAFYTFVTMFNVHWVTYRYSGNHLQSLVTSLIYVFSSYRIIDIWPRFALGEFIALTFLPLVLYGLYAILIGTFNDWPFLSFGLSLTMLSHVLSTYIDVGFCVLFFFLGFIFMLKHQFKKRIVSLIKSIFVFIMSSAIFLFPFIEQELSQNYAQPSPTNMSKNTASIYLLIKSTISNNYLNYTLSNHQGIFNTGIISLVIIIFGIMLFLKFNKVEQWLYISSIILLIATTILFPWEQFGKFNFINIMQFPFRILTIPTFLLAVLGGKEFIIIYSKFSAKYVKTLLLSFLLFITIIPYGYGLKKWKDQPVSIKVTDKVVNDAMDTNNYFSLYLDQYVPKSGIKILDAVSNDHYGKISGKRYKFDNILSKSDQIDYNELKIKKNDLIVLPLYYLKNIEVNINGHKQNKKVTNSGLVSFKSNVRANKIVVRYIPTILDQVGKYVSIVTWMWGLTYLVYKRVLKDRKYE